MERKQYKTKEEWDKEKGRDKFESTTPATKRENDYADAMGRQPGESPAEVDERCFNELMQNSDQEGFDFRTGNADEWRDFIGIERINAEYFEDPSTLDTSIYSPEQERINFMGVTGAYIDFDLKGYYKEERTTKRPTVSQLNEFYFESKDKAHSNYAKLYENNSALHNIAANNGRYPMCFKDDKEHYDKNGDPIDYSTDPGRYIEIVGEKLTHEEIEEYWGKKIKKSKVTPEIRFQAASFKLDNEWRAGGAIAPHEAIAWLNDEKIADFVVYHQEFDGNNSGLVLLDPQTKTLHVSIQGTGPLEWISNIEAAATGNQQRYHEVTAMVEAQIDDYISTVDPADLPIHVNISGHSNGGNGALFAAIELMDRDDIIIDFTGFDSHNLNYYDLYKFGIYHPEKVQKFVEGVQEGRHKFIVYEDGAVNDIGWHLFDEILGIPTFFMPTGQKGLGKTSHATPGIGMIPEFDRQGYEQALIDEKLGEWGEDGWVSIFPERMEEAKRLEAQFFRFPDSFNGLDENGNFDPTIPMGFFQIFTGLVVNSVAVTDYIITKSFGETAGGLTDEQILEVGRAVMSLLHGAGGSMEASGGGQYVDPKVFLDNPEYLEYLAVYLVSALKETYQIAVEEGRVDEFFESFSISPWVVDGYDGYQVPENSKVDFINLILREFVEVAVTTESEEYAKELISTLFTLFDALGNMDEIGSSEATKILLQEGGPLAKEVLSDIIGLLQSAHERAVIEGREDEFFESLDVLVEDLGGFSRFLVKGLVHGAVNASPQETEELLDSFLIAFEKYDLDKSFKENLMLLTTPEGLSALFKLIEFWGDDDDEAHDLIKFLFHDLVTFIAVPLAGFINIPMILYDVISSLVAEVPGLFEAAWGDGGFEGVIGVVLASCITVIYTAVLLISSLIDNFHPIQGIKNLLTGIFNTLKSLVNSLVNSLKTIGGEIVSAWESFKGFLAKAVTSVKNAVEKASPIWTGFKVAGNVALINSIFGIAGPTITGAYVWNLLHSNDELIFTSDGEIEDSQATLADLYKYEPIEPKQIDPIIGTYPEDFFRQLPMDELVEPEYITLPADPNQPVEILPVEKYFLDAANTCNASALLLSSLSLQMKNLLENLVADKRWAEVGESMQEAVQSFRSLFDFEVKLPAIEFITIESFAAVKYRKIQKNRVRTERMRQPKNSLTLSPSTSSRGGRRGVILEADFTELRNTGRELNRLDRKRSSLISAGRRALRALDRELDDDDLSSSERRSIRSTMRRIERTIEILSQDDLSVCSKHCYNIVESFQNTEKNLTKQLKNMSGQLRKIYR